MSKWLKTKLSGKQMLIFGFILHATGFFLAFEAMLVTMAEILYAGAGYKLYKNWQKEKFNKVTGIFAGIGFLVVFFTIVNLLFNSLIGI